MLGPGSLPRRPAGQVAPTRDHTRRAVTEAFDDTTWVRRVRSTVLLVLLLVVLGVVAAAGIGAVVVLAGSLIDQALE
jgi:hypothetical protein